MIKRTPRAPRRRNRLATAFLLAMPAITWVATIAAGKARLTCSVPVTIDDIPVDITVQGASPIAVTSVSATVFDLTYGSAVVATNVLVVPAGVLQVRSATGGALAAGSYTFP